MKHVKNPVKHREKNMNRVKTDRKWELSLYVAGKTSRGITAFRNLKNICADYLSNECSIEVIDITTDPVRAIRDRILAVPTTIRKSPGPSKTVIGDLSDTRRVLTGLDIKMCHSPISH